MKILITSDNHLGYKETDSVRKDDSFDAFEEILKLAKYEKADFVIQGGDLFDENKPSRNTYKRTIQLLKRHCLGGPAPGIRSRPVLNFEDRNLALSMPIIGIHGNHDDPSGFNAVSPMDVLQSTGLINYFGRCENVEKIVLRPILIEKGVRVALYGLGYIKDRIVYNAFVNANVQYEQPEGDDWYSILVVHQNRAPRPNEYLPEDTIPSFFNLVVYGHEHESVVLRHRNFDIIQCGSTVRTSLCEAETGEKFVYILDLSESIQIRRHALCSVRPFLMESMRVDTEDAEAAVQARLDKMISEAGKLPVPGRDEPMGALSAADMASPARPLLPLLRLRVEIRAGANLNKHRFSNYLEDRIANPNDVLRISKKVEKKTFKATDKEKQVLIGDMYGDILKDTELSILAPPGIVDALSDFINKEIKDSFLTLVQDSIDKILNHIDIETVVLEDIASLLKQAKSAIDRAQANHVEVASESEPDIVFDEKDVQSLCSNAADSLSFYSKGLDTGSHTSLVGEDGASQSAAPSANPEYTFIEEKKNAEEDQQLIKDLKNDPTIKKIKENSSDDDLLAFTKYL